MSWPGADAAILGLLVVYTSVAFALIRWLQRRDADRLDTVAQAA